jgi:hypothetical protein
MPTSRHVLSGQTSGFRRAQRRNFVFFRVKNMRIFHVLLKICLSPDRHIPRQIQNMPISGKTIKKYRSFFIPFYLFGKIGIFWEVRGICLSGDRHILRSTWNIRIIFTPKTTKFRIYGDLVRPLLSCTPVHRVGIFRLCGEIFVWFLCEKKRNFAYTVLLSACQMEQISLWRAYVRVKIGLINN